MGTSAPRNGPRPTTPLIPDWPGIPPLPPVPGVPPGPGGLPASGIPPTPSVPPAPSTPPAPSIPPSTPTPASSPGGAPAPVTPVLGPPPPTNRYNVSRRAMGAYARSGGSDKSSLRKALREYVRTAGGGKRNLARRMYSSVQSVERLEGVLQSFVQNGVPQTLTPLNLNSLAGNPTLDVLSALIDEVAPASGQLDDAIARQAYALTVERVDTTITQLNLTNLSITQVQEILAIYIEETIVCRVINDIGASLTSEQHDPVVCADMVEDLYQIVRGAVHQDIISGLSGTNAQLPPNTGQRIEDIYQLALDVLS